MRINRTEVPLSSRGPVSNEARTIGLVRDPSGPNLTSSLTVQRPSVLLGEVFPGFSKFTYLEPSGGDDSAIIQSHIQNNCEIWLGPGTFLWNTAVVKLPRNASGIRIRGSGIGVTTIKLSSGAPRAFDFNKIEDGDVFQNIAISDLTVDANSIGGKHHGILGNYAAGSIQTKIAFQNIYLERLTGINGPAPDVSGTNDRRWIALWAQNDDTDAKLEINRILCRDIDLKGGAYGISVVASRVTNTTGHYANCEFDRIFLDHCKHDTGVVPTEFITSANFHIGSRGYGKSVRINNCYGNNSADVGIEIDGMTDAISTNCRITDQWGFGCYGTNFAKIPNLTAQRILWINCKTRRSAQITGKTNAFAGFRATLSSEWKTEYISTFECRGCQFHKSDGTFAIKGEAARIDNVRRVVLDDFEATYESVVSNEEATAYTPAAIVVRNGVAGGLANPCHFIGQKIAVKVAGERIGAATVIFNPIVISDTGELIFEIDGLTVDFSVTGLTSTAFRGFQIGDSSAGQQTRGKLKGYRILKLTGDTGPRAFVLQDTNWITVVDRIELIDCDFSKMAGGEEIQFATSGGGTAQVTKVTARNCRPRSGSVKLEGAVASAATVTLPPQGEYIEVTGTTEITSIEPLPSGRRVTLQFTNATPGKVKVGSNLKIAGTYSPAQNNTLTLVTDGTNWYETSRASVT